MFSVFLKKYNHPLCRKVDMTAECVGEKLAECPYYAFAYAFAIEQSETETTMNGMGLSKHA